MIGGGALVGDYLLRFGFAVSLVVSIVLIVCVARGWTDAMDQRLLAALKPVPSDGSSRLATAAKDFTALGGDTLRIVFLLGCMGLLVADGRAATAWLLLAVFGSGRLALYGLKALTRRPRPDASGHGVVTFTTSFPSGHTFMAACLFTAAALLIPVAEPQMVQVLAIVLALAVSLAVAATRLMLGVHWPTDIVVGWLGGIAWATGWVVGFGQLAT